MDEDRLTIREMQRESHRYAVDNGFWDERWEVDPKFYIPQCLSLVHSEVTEALESIRGEGGDPLGEELADIIIRVGDIAEEQEIDLEDEIRKKQEKNRQREYKHGKEF